MIKVRLGVLNLGVVVALASFSSVAVASGGDVSQAAWERSAQESIDELARQGAQDNTLQSRTSAIPVKNQSKLNEAIGYKNAYSNLLGRIKYLEGLPVQPVGGNYVWKSAPSIRPCSSNMGGSSVRVGSSCSVLGKVNWVRRSSSCSSGFTYFWEMAKCEVGTVSGPPVGGDDDDDCVEWSGYGGMCR